VFGVDSSAESPQRKAETQELVKLIQEEAGKPPGAASEVMRLNWRENRTNSNIGSNSMSKLAYLAEVKDKRVFQAWETIAAEEQAKAGVCSLPDRISVQAHPG
jgi:hypothetical protein